MHQNLGDFNKGIENTRGEKKVLCVILTKDDLRITYCSSDSKRKKRLFEEIFQSRRKISKSIEWVEKSNLWQHIEVWSQKKRNGFGDRKG